MEVNDFINKIIENQKKNTVQKLDFCCGVLSYDNLVNVIETDKIKIIYVDEGKCEIKRKKNNNPVIFRDENQKIYRQHGEWIYLKHEMLKLAGMYEEAESLLNINQDFNYD